MRHRPETTLIYQIVTEHWTEFQAELAGFHGGLAEKPGWKAAQYMRVSWKRAFVLLTHLPLYGFTYKVELYDITYILTLYGKEDILYLYDLTYKQVEVMEKIIRSNKEFGEAIRLARANKSLRQVDVAKKASVRQALISELENGETSAKLDTIIRVLAALDMDLSIVPRRKAEFDPTEY